MRIPIVTCNVDKLTSALAKANGNARAHTLAAASGPKTFTSAYQRLGRTYIATWVDLIRTGSGWTVIAIKRVDRWTDVSDGGFARLGLTAGQREIVSSKAVERTCKLR